MTQKVVDFLNIFQGFRKTIVMLMLILIGVIFRIKGYIGPDNMVDLLKATTISYFGSNSIEHFTAMYKTHLETNAAAVALAAKSPPAIPEQVAAINVTTEEG